MRDAPDSKTALGTRFFQARLAMSSRLGRTVTQAEAGKANGVTGAAVGLYEAGKNEPSIDLIGSFAEYYGVRKLWLGFNEGPMTEAEVAKPRPKPEDDKEMPVFPPAPRGTRLPSSTPAATPKRRRGGDKG